MAVSILCLLLLFTPAFIDATTTPSPTPSGTWICGEQNTGSYSSNQWYLMVNIPQPGNLTLDTSKCAFSVNFIEVSTESNTYLYTRWYGDPIMIFTFMSSGNYRFKLFISGPDSGTYDIITRCSIPPTNQPSASPNISPTTSQPTNNPSNQPSQPSASPTALPTTNPSTVPSITPSNVPTMNPNTLPTIPPSNVPTINPTNLPIINPSKMPTMILSKIPTITPTSPFNEGEANEYSTDSTVEDDSEEQGELMMDIMDNQLFLPLVGLAAAFLVTLAVCGLCCLHQRRKNRINQQKNTDIVESGLQLAQTTAKNQDTQVPEVIVQQTVAAQKQQKIVVGEQKIVKNDPDHDTDDSVDESDSESLYKPTVTTKGDASR